MSRTSLQRRQRTLSGRLVERFRQTRTAFKVMPRRMLGRRRQQKPETSSALVVEIRKDGAKCKGRTAEIHRLGGALAGAGKGQTNDFCSPRDRRWRRQSGKAT
eukprot:8113792-Pyramimonas_sp.AAC.1